MPEPNDNPADFTDMIPTSDETVVEQVDGQDFVLSETADLPASAFAQMIDQDRRFLPTWRKGRKDLPDKRRRAHETELASMAMNAGWGKQDIINLLIAWCREHGIVPTLRAQHYAQILQSANTQIARMTAQERLTEMLVACPDNEGALRTCLNEILGIKITRLIKFMGDPPVFLMQTDKGDITLGNVHHLVDQKAFREKVAAVTQILISRCPENAWQDRAQALLSICEDVDVGDASHPDTEMLGWIEYYLTERAIVIHDLSEAAITRSPVYYVGHTHIQKDNFGEWLKRHSGQSFTPHELAIRLKRVGATGVSVPVKYSGRKSTRHYFRLPNGVGPSVDESRQTPLPPLRARIRASQ